MRWVAAQYGLIQLFSDGIRSVTGKFDPAELRRVEEELSLNPGSLGAGPALPFRFPTPLSRALGTPLPLPPPGELGREAVNNHEYLLRFFARDCGDLIARCYEAVKARRDPTVPEWEFFRHCRNAASHDNRFSFAAHEPARPAAWRGLEIERTLEGTPLIDETDDSGKPVGLLSVGDPIVVVWDIEQLL